MSFEIKPAKYMSTNTQLQKTSESRFVEFIPFGAADKIKLSVSIIQNIIAVPTKSGKTCGERDAMKFLMLCQAQRLNPFAGDAYLVGYDGKDGVPKFSLITAQVALLKRAETCADYEGMESGIIIKEDGKLVERDGPMILEGEELVGGWAKVYRKGRKPTYSRLSLSQRRPNYPTPFWEGAKAAEQIEKCAQADALRTTFPTLLGGMYQEAEIVRVEDRPPAELPASRLVDVKPVESPPEQSEPPKASDTPPEHSKQQELADFVTSNGFSFGQFQKWATETGQLEDAASLPDFMAVPDPVAIRCLRAKVGLLKGLQQTKEEAA